MNALLPDPVLLGAFVAASLVLALTPGPAVLYIVARSLAQGRRSGLASVAAVAGGNLANAVAAALGLAALFAVSSLAFTVVKWAGAAYLVWLGIQALRRPAQPASAAARAGAGGDGAAVTPSQPSLRRVMRDGFLVALLNPKTTLFFAAFLPQFMSPHASAAVQSVSLGALFVLIAATTDCLWVLGASWLAPRVAGLERAGAAGRYFSASTYIGLGVFTALSGERAK